MGGVLEKSAESEKITVNLGFVDLGRIDLLVREGFYSNRADFIRTAIRHQLQTDGEAVDRSLLPQVLQDTAWQIVFRQGSPQDAERIGLPTIFFPMTRVERISLDEPSGSIPSMAEIFQRKIGRSLMDYLAQFA